MAYQYRLEDGSVDPAALKKCRREVERDPKLSDADRHQWLARFDHIEASKEAKFPGTLKASTEGTATVIDVLGDIGESFWSEGVTASAVARQIANAKGPIKLRINSPGGDAHEAIAIQTLLQQAPNDVEADILGLAASAGTIVALGANRVRMAENAAYMIHEARTHARGDARELRSAVQALEVFNEGAAAAYSRKSGLPVADIKKLMADATWMTAAKAHELGFVDEIFAPQAVAALVDLDDVPEAIAAAIKPKVSNMSKVAKRLALKDDASEDAILAEIDRLLAENFPPTKPVTALVEEDAEEETEVTAAAAPVTPLPAPTPQPEASELTAIQVERAKLHKAQVGLAVDTAIASGKLTPALRDTAVAACGSTPEQLSAQVALWDAMPALVSRKAVSLGTPPQSGALSAEQLKLAQLAGVTPEQWLAAKKQSHMENRDA